MTRVTLGFYETKSDFALKITELESFHAVGERDMFSSSEHSLWVIQNKIEHSSFVRFSLNTTDKSAAIAWPNYLMNKTRQAAIVLS